MRIPNVPERMKEVPAQALRAVFAGIGQALLMSDRVRRRLKDQQETNGQAEPAVKIPVTEPRVAARATEPAAAAGPEPAPDVQPAAAPPAAAPPAAEAPAGPPFPNYDELSIASLRARLRGLDLTQVRQLLSYEEAHGSRSDVVAMYQRRIEKLGEAGS